MKKIFCLALVVMLMMSGCTKQEEPKKTDPVQTDKVTGTIEEIGTAFIQTMADQDFERLNTAFDYDDAMQKLADSDQLKAAFGPSMNQLGALKEIQQTSEVVQGELTIVIFPVIFEKLNICINVVFDTENRIAGANISEYVAPSDVVAVTLPKEAVEKEISFTARDGKAFSGSLVLPNSEGSFPVVVFVHGSGPNDRNETLYGNTVFKDIAYLLAEKGIATLRYDKRTYLYGAESATNLEMTVNEETVYDAQDAFEWIKTQENINPDQVYILGHSLGAMMMPRIAEEAKATGYIMMAAPVNDLASIMKMQYEYLSQFSKSSEETKFYESALEELKQLDNLDSLKADQVVQGGYPAYWKDLLSYKPIETAESMKEPVLMLQGEQDYQVPMSEYQLWKDAYGSAENWKFESFSGLSHMMMPGDLTKSPNTYYMQKANVDSRVIDAIAEFILK